MGEREEGGKKGEREDEIQIWIPAFLLVMKFCSFAAASSSSPPPQTRRFFPPLFSLSEKVIRVLFYFKAFDWLSASPPLLSSYKAACKLAFSTAGRVPFSSCFVVCAHSEAKKELPEGQFVADYLNGESRFIRGGGGGRPSI